MAELAQSFPGAREVLDQLQSGSIKPHELTDTQLTQLITFEGGDELGFSRALGSLSARVKSEVKKFLKIQAKAIKAQEQASAKTHKQILHQVAQFETFQVGPYDAPLPDGFEFSGGSVWKGDEVIVRQPLALVERFVEAGEGLRAASDVSVRVAWVDQDGQCRTHIVSSSRVRDSRSLVSTLGRFGVLATSNNASDLVKIFAFQESLLEATGSFARNCGWNDGRFAVPSWTDDELGQPYALEVSEDPEANVTSLSKAFGRAGTWDEYKKALNMQPDNPQNWAVIYSSVASVLLDLLDVSLGACVSIYGETGTGKSQLLKLGAAAWGNPVKLALAFDSTAAGVEKNATFLNGVGLFLDETQVTDSVGRGESMVDRVVYMVANGRARGRKTEDAQEFKVLMLTTGEVSIHSFKLRPGAQNRVLEMPTPPTKPGAKKGYFFDTPQQSDETERLYSENYGHLGPMFVQAVASRDRQELAREVNRRVERFRDMDHLDTRMAKIIAVIELAGEIIHTDLGVKRPQVDVALELAQSSSKARHRFDTIRLTWVDVYQHHLDYSPQSGMNSAGEQNIHNMKKHEMEACVARLGVSGARATVDAFIERKWIAKRKDRSGAIRMVPTALGVKVATDD